MKKLFAPLFLIFLIILVFFILLVAYSHNATRNRGIYTSIEIDTLNIEKFAFEFYQSHKNLANNSITRKEAAKDFQDQFKEAMKSVDLLKDIPMNLRTLKDQNDGNYTAHFWTAKLDRKLISPFDDINFDIVVTIPKEVVVNLVEDSNYLLDVSYVSHIDKIETFQYLIGYNDWVKTEHFELLPNENSYNGEQTYIIDLGLMLVDFISIQPYY